jgi:hypothetical protein
MDLASEVCTPRAPGCDACPLADLCASRGMVPVAQPKKAAMPFAMTTRWLRGRLVAAVTSAPLGSWVRLPEQLGHHDADAIRLAARALELEGFLDFEAGAARVRQ